jgi:hypothetical protein
MFAYAEQLYPDTSGPGRETIRQELKSMQQRWEHLLEKAGVNLIKLFSFVADEKTK